MGCCQSDSSVEHEAQRNNGSSASFQGQGQKLGTIHEQKPLNESRLRVDDSPNIDPNLDDSTREKMRADRAAAAEARAKKLQGGTTKKKTYENNQLRGPNSRNTMQWTL